MSSRESLSEYERGYLDGLWAYGWWKDGTCYVGTTGKTYAEARREFLDAPDGAVTVLPHVEGGAVRGVHGEKLTVGVMLTFPGTVIDETAVIRMLDAGGFVETK